MSDESNNQDASDEQAPEPVSPSAGKKQSRLLLMLFLVFVGFVTIVFLTQNKASINWVEDYQIGLEQARQQNKPVLLAFHKVNHYYSAMVQYTYSNPDVIKYVDVKFVPILINCDKQPRIAKKYNINYYPTHYVEQPNSNKLSNALIGCYPDPHKFIERIDHLLDTIKHSDK